jgi:hypothetical protein
MREKHIILAIHVMERMKNVPEMQKYFSDYGCYIKTRLGLHEASDNYCSPNGIIILEMLGDETKADELFSKLNAIDGLEVKKIEFDHEN